MSDRNPGGGEGAVTSNAESVPNPPLTSPGPREVETQLRLLMVMAASALHDAGAEAQARRLSTVPIRLESRLACVFKAIRQVEQSLQVRMGALMISPTPIGAACELLSLAKVGAHAAVTGAGNVHEWLLLLHKRGVHLMGKEHGGDDGKQWQGPSV